MTTTSTSDSEKLLSFVNIYINNLSIFELENLQRNALNSLLKNF